MPGLSGHPIEKKEKQVVKMEKINLSSMDSGAVTLIDVLGWKGIWQRKENPINDLINIINTAKRKNDLLKENGKSRFKEAALKTEIISISDSIAMVSYGEVNNTLELHAGLGRMIIRDALKHKIPLRGATCFGKFSSNGSILIGPAIDEVASWYEMAEWIGIIHTPSAYLLCEIEEFNSKKLVVEHDVKTKNGLFTTNCVDWRWNGITLSFCEQDLKKMFYEMQPITPDISKKIMNTIEFYKNRDVNHDAIQK